MEKADAYVTVVKLGKIIKDTNGNPIKEITVREPTFKDLRTHGLPVSGDGSIDWSKASRISEALTGIQAPVLDQLSGADSIKLVSAISNMFAVDEETGNE